MPDRYEPIGINRTIFDQICTNERICIEFNLGNIIENGNRNIWNFLASAGFDERKEKAMKILRSTLEGHNKEDAFLPVLDSILRIEEGTQRFNPYVRDHVSHSVYVYLFGIATYCNLDPVYYALHFPFSWKLASIFHDFGNPPSLLFDAINKYLASINYNDNEDNNLVQSTIRFESFSDLVEREGKSNNAFEIIQERINEWGFDFQINEEFNNRLNNAIVDHGVLGAILLLKKLDDLYSDNNPEHRETFIINRVDWGRHHFDREIVSAITAISLHNVISRDYDCIIEYLKNPLLFLLVLSDTVQEWDRFSPGQRVFDPYSVEVKTEGGNISLTFHLPEYKKEEIRRTLGKLRYHGEKITIN